MTRFRELEKCKRHAQAEANRTGHVLVIIDCLGDYWVRRPDKAAHVCERYPKAEVVCEVKPEALFTEEAKP